MNISNVGSSQAIPASHAAPSKKEAVTVPETKTTPSSSPSATVKISNASQKLMQEATETPAQTAKEAASGDAQAQRLLKSEANAKDMNDHDGDGH